LALVACSSDDDDDTTSGKSGAGTGGSQGGSAGSKASGGTGGSSSGKGGSDAGTAGKGGSGKGGTGGSAGKGGSGGDSAGTSGDPGNAGDAGADMGGGTGGTAGSGNSGGGGSGGDGGIGPNGVWRPFMATSAWNTPIPENPTLDPDNDAMILDFSTIPNLQYLWINNDVGFSIPVYFVDSTVTPMVTITAGLGANGFRNGSDEYSPPGSGPAPIPDGALAAEGTDRHLMIVDKAVGTEWGFFDADHGSGSWVMGVAAAQDLKGDGVRPPERNDPWWAGHGPRACGFGGIAGLITVDEIKSGSIEHALVIAYPHIRSRYYTPPASTAQGTTSEALPTRGIPCGARIQLDPLFDIATLNLSEAANIIARALQKYGAFVSDYSGAMSIYADSHPDARAYWTSGVLPGNALGTVPLGMFRVLEIGMLYDNAN
jgi:hypothetical protein